MARLALFLVTVLILTIQSQAVTVINNATVSSDVIQELFLTEIKNNLRINPADTYQKIKCATSLMEIVGRMPSLQVLPFIDSWGSIPSGVLKLHFTSIGNFDQCLDISVDFNNTFGTVNGQHCFASIPLLSGQSLGQIIPRSAVNGDIIDIQDFLRISIGVCVPDSCTEDMLTEVFQQAVGNAFNGALSSIYVDRCKVLERPKLTSTEITGITILSIFGGLVIVSTLYDMSMQLIKKTQNSLLLAFSVFANSKKLFAINTKKSPNTIECLAGIRVFSMAWVVYGHNYLFAIFMPILNALDIFKWFKTAGALHVINATVSVDSFLLISGLLVAWLGFKELDKTKGKLNVVMMYVHRYIRLTPPVAGVILFLISAYKLLIHGPIQADVVTNDRCDDRWWVTLLYVQNYAWSDDMCIPQSWYLALDFQLYIISPLLLIPMWKWGKKFSPVLVGLGLLSIGCIIATFFANGFNSLVGLDSPERMQKIYFPTHARYAPYLIGLGLGYFMHVNRERTFKPSKLIQLLGWTISFGTIVAVIFGTYFSMNSDTPTTVLEAAMYESLKRVSWTIALGWIIFACHFGFGGLVNSILGHPYWQPLSRLTYSLYLVHMAVMGFNYGNVRTDIYFSEYNQILTFWSSFGMSIVAALALTFTFEAPVLVLEKAIFRKKDSKQNMDLVNNMQVVTDASHNKSP